MSVETEVTYRRTHAFFKCPAGHDQHFAGETKEEATIRRLKAQLEDRDATTELYAEIIDKQRAEMRSLRARLGWRNHWLDKSPRAAA